MTPTDDNRKSPQTRDGASEDAAEEARIRAILESPAYVRADVDLDWIGSPEMRGARLLLEYAKPQVKLIRENVRSTIVLFGSTRIVEPEAARRSGRLRPGSRSFYGLCIASAPLYLALFDDQEHLQDRRKPDAHYRR